MYSELKQSTFDQKFHYQAGKLIFIECLDLIYFIMMFSCKMMCGEKVGTETFSIENLAANSPVCLQAVFLWSVTFVCCYCLSHGLCLHV